MLGDLAGAREALEAAAAAFAKLPGVIEIPGALEPHKWTEYLGEVYENLEVVAIQQVCVRCNFATTSRA